MSTATESLMGVSASMNAGIVQAEDTEAALARLRRPDGDEPIPGKDDEGNAQFGTPEAITAGVLTSLVLGPVGGILFGAAQGWLKKKSDQGILDRLSMQETALTDASDVQYDRLSQLATDNPQDKEQTDGFRSGLDTAREMMKSPSLQAEGVQMFGGIVDAMGRYETTNEAQRIVAEQTAKAETRQLGLDRYNQITEKRGRFDPVANEYRKSSTQYNGLIAALSAKNFSPVDAHTAAVKYSKTIDPDSAVLSGEVDAVSNMGTIVEQFGSFMKGLENGELMTPKQRNDMMRTAARSQALNTAGMQRHETKFANELADGEFPDKYYDDFRVDQPLLAPTVIPTPPPKKVIETAKQENAEPVKITGQQLWDIGGQIINSGGKLENDWNETTAEASAFFGGIIDRATPKINRPTND